MQSNRPREPRTKVSRESRSEKAEDSNDVATQLELKTPGSTSDKVRESLVNRTCHQWEARFILKKLYKIVGFIAKAREDQEM